MASEMPNDQKLSRNSASDQLKMIEMIKNKTISLLDIMDYYFCYTDYKSKLQAQAINMILSSRNDVFVSMPDGYGRSLCYEFPALVKTTKVTIVFCPLIPRIQRHVAVLSRLNIFTQALTIITDPKKRNHIINEVLQRTSSSTIFYVTPNEADARDFQVLVKLLIQANRVAYIVVDEVHSENQWLYGQKKDYKLLGTIRKLYPQIPWVIVTSEVGAEVVNMMNETLNLDSNLLSNVSRFATSCYRPNIHYDVIHDNTNRMSCEHLKKFIKKCIDGDKNEPFKSCGIIFCKTINAANVLSAAIQINDIMIAPYHRGLCERQQLSIRSSFMNGSVNVIVVAGSYGKSINKLNIRFIVHWGIPASITQYYKETGLAGKDGNSARCRIYDCDNSLLNFNEATEKKMKEMLNVADIGDNLKNALTAYLIFIQSRLVKDYCFSDNCRHSFLAYYFGEMKPRCNNKCDICMEECNLFYKGRTSIKKSVDELGLEAFIQKVIAKYESHGPTQMSTTETLNLLKICDEIIKISNFKSSTDVMEIFNRWQSKLMLVKYQAEDDQFLALSCVQDGI